MKKLTLPLAALAAATLALSAGARDLAPDTLSLQAGAGKDTQAQAAVGLGWDLDWQRPLGPLLATAHAELFAGVWRARHAEAEPRHFAQFGVLPTLRLRFDQGRSPWFVEAGIGPSWHHRPYVTPDKRMGSRFNFTDAIGLGRTFGPQGRQAWTLRYHHVSNGGYRRPNPGEDFLLLRYTTRF